MHRFLWQVKEPKSSPPFLHGAHLLGQDNVPVRGDIVMAGGEIRCSPRTQDPVALSLLCRVDGFGIIQLQTTRLPARDKPYLLSLELARHQLMRLSIKREEWGLFDYNGMEPVSAEIDRARQQFVKALQHADKPADATRLADEALAIGLHAGEQMARFHANVFLGRRQQTGGFNRPFLGVCALRALSDPGVMRRVTEVANLVQVPINWRDIQPAEKTQTYDVVDAAIKQCAAAGLPVRAGALLNFGVRSVPDWMYIWENDFEAIYEAAREHVERTARRYAKQVTSWVAVSGLHADNVFGFSFEQVMELTRMACTVIKQVAPRCHVIVDITQPWGEYYARNPQTVPPLLYADMAVQSGVNFDAFGIQFVCGLGSDGFHVRDLLQVSALVDKLANLGKPLHVTAISAPSAAPPRGPDGITPGGEWRAAWTDGIQADWLSALCEVCLSKPYVETVCFAPLRDDPDDAVPAGGLLSAEGTPKPIFERLRALRTRYASDAGK